MRLEPRILTITQLVARSGKSTEFYRRVCGKERKQILRRRLTALWSAI